MPDAHITSPPGREFLHEIRTEIFDFLLNVQGRGEAEKIER